MRVSQFALSWYGFCLKMKIKPTKSSKSYTQNSVSLETRLGFELVLL